MDHLLHNNVTIHIPETLWEKSRGLLGQEKLLDNGCLLLLQCNWVHSFFMQNPIKLYFLDESFSIVHIIPQFVPNRFSPFVIKATHTLETPIIYTDTKVEQLLPFFQEVLRT